MLKGVLILILAILVSGDVHVLTDDNFDSFLNENELVLVEFYAPWCGHCKRLEPEYDRASAQLGATDGVLAKVDATVETKVAERFDIGGYPTLKLFRNGQPTEYEGGRTANDIVSFMKKQSGPALKPLETEEDFELFLPDGEGQEPVVVVFSEKESPVTAFMTDFANKFRNEYQFGHVFTQEVAGKQDMGSIVLFKPFDEKQNKYNGILSEDNILEFLKGNSVPSVAEIGPSNYQSYVKRGLPISWLFINPDDTKATDEVQKQYRTVAPDLKSKLSLVYLSGVQYKQMATKLGLSGEKLPALSVEKDGLHYTFPETEELTAENMKPWFEKFLDGKMEPTMKSEPIPASLFDEDHVATIVHDNFNDVVMDDTKDVLVEFYAPWCGHCKSLIPTWKKLGQAFKGVPSIVIAKTDATANDYPAQFKITGFPTIKLVTSKGNKVVEYEGERELKSFIQFLKANAGTPFEIPSEASEPDDNDEL